MSLRCQKLAENLAENAHPDYEVRLNWRGVEERKGRFEKSCVIDIINNDVRREIPLKGWEGWERGVASHGSLELMNGRVDGEIPTLRRAQAVKRIEDCGAEVSDVHTYPFDGRVINHVHFTARDEAIRCLTEKLLEEP